MLNKKEEKTIKVWPETKLRLNRARMKRSTKGKTITLVQHIDDLSKLPVTAFNYGGRKLSN